MWSSLVVLPLMLIDGDLQVRVVTPDGQTVQNASVVLRKAISKESIGGSGHEWFRRLAYGDYTLQAQAHGFQSSNPLPVRIGQPVEFRLVVLDYEDHDHVNSRIEEERDLANGPCCLISGEISGFRQAEDIRVRLVGAFRDVVSDQLVSPLGLFSFDGVPAGEYVVLVFDRNQLAASRQVQVLRWTTLRLQLSRPPSR